MKVRKGMMLGKWKVMKVFKRGPYTWVNVQCTCEALTKRSRSLCQMLSGTSLSCGCYKRERKQFLQQAFYRALGQCNRRTAAYRRALARIRKSYEPAA